MNFDLDPALERFREEVRDLVASVVTPEVHQRVHDSGTEHDWALYSALAERGWIARLIPRRANDADALTSHILFSELERAGAPWQAIATTLTVTGILNLVAPPHIIAEVVPRVEAATALLSLGYTEPDHGSDLTSVRLKATRHGDGWRIDGSKMWTTMAHEASWILLLTRTSITPSPRDGLTMFLVPTDTPGVKVQPVHTMFERSNETVYDAIELDDRWRIGEIDGGWDVMRVGLGLERGAFGGAGHAVPLLRAATEWAVTPTTGEVRPIDDALIADRLAQLAIDVEVARLLGLRSAWIAGAGGTPSIEGSVAKVFTSETYLHHAEEFQRLGGVEALRRDGQAAAGQFERDARRAPGTTIHGGTTEINLNNIARHHLGLPRASKGAAHA